MSPSETRAMGVVEVPRTGRWVGWALLATLPIGAVAARNLLPAWGFMWTLAFSIYAGLKWLTWWRIQARIAHEGWRSVAYLLAWPGMDAESFLDANQRAAQPPRRDWFWAFFETILGAILIWAVVRIVPAGKLLMRGWVGMVGLILLLHFGTFQLVGLLWQRLGVDARPIMSAPLRSTSLSEFWGKRWNLGFRQLSYDLIFSPVQKSTGPLAAGFLVFLVSGLIHDLVISLPARAGYGLPTAYFVLQGIGVAFERSNPGQRLGLRQGLRGWFFMAVFTAGPVFWLFHPWFVVRVILPFLQAIHAL